MRKVYVIGVGAGDPEHLTVQAIKRLNEVDVFFVLDKGRQKADLVLLREEILRRYVERPSYRVVRVPDPERDRNPADYQATVADWRRRRADLYQRMIGDELGENQCGAFLAWGDPALYDSTIGILDTVLERNAVEFDYQVVPGISSVSALAAQHRTSVTQVGKPVLITTGRKLTSQFPDGVDDVIVMLDGHCAFIRLTEDAEIFWGAYLGTPDEILVSGPVEEVAGKINDICAEARRRKGWIMDTYLLRKSKPTG